MSNVLRGVITNPDKIYGKSAYEIAVKHGYDGTEAEWIASVEANRVATEEAKEVVLESEKTVIECAQSARASRDEAVLKAESARVSMVSASQFALNANSHMVEAAISATQAQIAAETAQEAKKKLLEEIELAAEIVQTTGESETAVMSQKAVTERISRCLSIESDDAYVISDGTDFNTLTEPRTYKVRTWSSGCTMKNSPNKNSGRLIVMNTSDHDRVLQMYVANTTDALVYIRIKDGGWSKWESVVTSDVTDKLRSDIDSYRTFPVKLRVMQYNIGRFNMGFDHTNPKINSEEVVAKIANYKRFFGEYQPNILGVQEFTDYIDCTDNEHETNATLFDDVFPYSTTPYYGNILKSDIVPYVAEDIILDEGEEHSQPAKKAEYLINGKVLGVIVGAGDWRDVTTENPNCFEHRKAELKNAMARLSECDHAIICLDWNVKSQEEFDDFVSEVETAGYVVANGGYFGSFETYGNDNCYRCIDQILCKGAKIKNVIKPDVYENLASDHYPLIADIILI